MGLAKKICLLGDFSVGKTSLIRRYVHDEFSLDYHATVGVQVHQYRDEIETCRGVVSIDQVIWDIEGSKIGDEVVTSYILGSAGALIVGDAARRSAVDPMSSHARRFLDVLPGRPVVFAMNKADLVAEDARPDPGELVDTFGGEFVHTSALTGEGVGALFHTLCRRILDVGA
ncbi:MAG: GTP-binding protein [Rhizobiales bacterium]|nr:GTP-binding protein [Hyphomicrobiales bacterium]